MDRNDDLFIPFFGNNFAGFFWRSARVVEWDALEMRFTPYRVTGVRIPPSPPPPTESAYGGEGGLQLKY